MSPTVFSHFNNVYLKKNLNFLLHNEKWEETGLKFDFDFCLLLLKISFELQPSAANHAVNETGNVESSGIAGWHFIECVSHCWGYFLC